MKVTKKQIREMLETAKDSLQNNGTPCIYQYKGKIDISRGDQFGTAEPVYNGKAEVIVDTEELRELLNPYDYTFETAIEIVKERIEGIEN